MKEKIAEGLNKEDVKIELVGHSLGGMVSLMHLVRCGKEGSDPICDSAVMISPAGYLKDLPKLWTFASKIM